MRLPTIFNSSNAANVQNLISNKVKNYTTRKASWKAKYSRSNTHDKAKQSEKKCRTEARIKSGGLIKRTKLQNK
jgi:hypothetical protein